MDSNSFSHLLNIEEIHKIVSDALDLCDGDDQGYYCIVDEKVVFDYLGVGFSNVKDARFVLGIDKD